MVIVDDTLDKIVVVESVNVNMKLMMMLID